MQSGCSSIARAWARALAHARVTPLVLVDEVLFAAHCHCSLLLLRSSFAAGDSQSFFKQTFMSSQFAKVGSIPLRPKFTSFKVEDFCRALEDGV